MCFFLPKLRYTNGWTCFKQRIYQSLQPLHLFYSRKKYKLLRLSLTRLNSTSKKIKHIYCCRIAIHNIPNIPEEWQVCTPHFVVGLQTLDNRLSIYFAEDKTKSILLPKSQGQKKLSTIFQGHCIKKQYSRVSLLENMQ